MPGELGLKLACDREYVSANSRQVLAIIGIVGGGPGAVTASAEHFRGVELGLCVDCSGSMNDPVAGPGTGPSKLDKAIEAVHSMIGQLASDDLLSIVGFDEKAEVILRRLSGAERSQFRDPATRQGVEGKLHGFGGRTNILEALQLSRSLMGMAAGSVQRIVLLSDGMANEPGSLGSEQAIMAATLRYAEQLGGEGVVLDALGYGLGQDLHPDFLSDLAGRSTGGVWEHIQGSPDAVLNRILSDARKVYASNVELAITFPVQVQAGDIYRFEPQIMYLGSAPVTAGERTVRLRAGQLQSGKAYSWMLEATVPAVAGVLLVAQVRLSYRLADESRHEEHGTLAVQMTDNEGLASRRDGNYMFFYEQAKLNKLEKALSDAQVRRDAQQMVSLLTQMIQRCRELGLNDVAMKYQRILDSFRQDQNFARASLAAASTSTSSKSSPSDHIRGEMRQPPLPPKPHRPADPRRRR